MPFPLSGDDPLRGLSGPRRQDIRNAVTRGEAVDRPDDAPYAVALAVSMRRAAKKSWSRPALVVLALALIVLLLIGAPMVVIVVLAFAVFTIGVREWMLRSVPKAREAERRNREIARFHRLDVDG